MATQSVRFQADAIKLRMKSCLVTLGSAGTVTSVTLPEGTQGYRLYPSADIRHAIDEDPEADGTGGSGAVAASAFKIGNVAKANQHETRILRIAKDGQATTLRLRSLSAAPTVEVEVF